MDDEKQAFLQLFAVNGRIEVCLYRFQEDSFLKAFFMAAQVNAIVSVAAIEKTQ